MSWHHRQPLLGLLALALGTLVALVACDSVVDWRYVDPPITLAEDNSSLGEPPQVSIGFKSVDTGVFEAMQDGDPLWVVHGTQGGTWTMPTLRTRGIGPLATVSCQLVTASGEMLPGAHTITRFFRTPDGSAEVPNFPIPVWHASPREGEPIDDLYGQQATLSCGVDDGDGHAGETSVEVILESG